MKRKQKKAVFAAFISLLICTTISCYFYSLFNKTTYYAQETQSTSVEAEIPIPIVMYHSILNENKSNSKYIISPKTFENDVIYLLSNDYTPVFMKDVINYVNGKGTLPSKPIVLTFDDGYYNNHYYISPILKKYGIKAVISVIGKESDLFTNSPDEHLNYSHVTWDHILAMHLSGNWEIQNHSYNCHSYDDRNGISQKKSETFKEYKSFLTDDIMEAQNKIAYVTGVSPTTLTYPFGAFSKNTDKIIKSLGFKASLSCTEGVSTIEIGDYEGLFKLKRHLRPPDVSSEKFFEFLD
jgi:peptidoglycan/xylan/chitin deacetylase (PgdA/CDA1 family)